MAEKQIIDVPAEAQQETQQEEKVVGEIHIKVLEGGGLQLHVPETSKEFTHVEIEHITQLVHSQLHDNRIAQMAVDMFKQRLG